MITIKPQRKEAGLFDEKSFALTKIGKRQNTLTEQSPFQTKSMAFPIGVITSNLASDVRKKDEGERLNKEDF